MVTAYENQQIDECQARGEFALDKRHFWEQLLESVNTIWTPKNLLIVQDFLYAMPLGTLVPTSFSSLDARIDLLWTLSNRSLGISFRRKDTALFYYWKEDENSGQGEEVFNGTSIPPRILFELEQICKPQEKQA